MKKLLPFVVLASAGCVVAMPESRPDPTYHPPPAAYTPPPSQEQAQAGPPPVYTPPPPQQNYEAPPPYTPPPQEGYTQNDNNGYDDGSYEESAPPPEDVEVEAPPEPDYAQAVYVNPGYDSAPVYAVQYAPPPMRYEPPPPEPYADAVWVGGYWVWDTGAWAWMTGHWTASRPGYYWCPPYYENRNGVVIFQNGHFLREGVYYQPPPMTSRYVVTPARPGYRGYPPPRGQYGSFVPPPPGSRPGLIVPAPAGTPPQVMVSQPPVSRPGMVVHAPGPMGHRPGVDARVYVEAPGGVTKSGAPVHSSVPRRTELAGALPPRVAVAPPSPPPSVVSAHRNALSPAAVNPPRPGSRFVIPPTAQHAYQAQHPSGRPGFNNGPANPNGRPFNDNRYNENRPVNPGDHRAPPPQNNGNRFGNEGHGNPGQPPPPQNNGNRFGNEGHDNGHGNPGQPPPPQNNGNRFGNGNTASTPESHPPSQPHAMPPSGPNTGGGRTNSGKAPADHKGPPPKDDKKH